MTIDEAIAKHRKIAKTQKALYDACTLKEQNKHFLREAEEHEQLAEWLEELKDYRDKNKMVVRIDVENIESVKNKCIKLAKEQYDKAIDDCIKEVEEEEKQHNHTITKDCLFWLKRKLEQLKAGGDDENTNQKESR